MLISEFWMHGHFVPLGLFTLLVASSSPLSHMR